MKMKRTLPLLTLLSLALSSCGKATMSFTYAGAKKDFEAGLYFEDSYFLAPSTEHNPHLATASMSFAMASFASALPLAIQGKTRYANIRSLLANTGFEDFQANEDYRKPSGQDTIGLVFAHKKVEKKELVYVGIRGAHYDAEWASNFTIADPNIEYVKEESPEYHFGFYKAANQLISELKGYLATNQIQGEIKLWTSGFSRAGATANIAAGLLDQAIARGEKPLGDGVSLAKEDLYAYCFEPPMGAPVTVDADGKLLARGADYSNIFNYVNFNDPVPMVAMKEVGFTRFGQDRYFPDPMSYLDYGDFTAQVKEYYEKMPNYDERGGDFPVPSFKVQSVHGRSLTQANNYSAWPQGLFLKEFVSLLAKDVMGAIDVDHIPDAKYTFVTDLQPALRYIFRLIYIDSNFKGSFIDLGVSLINDIRGAFDIDDLLEDIVHPELRQFFIEDLTLILRRGLSKFGIEFSFEDAKKWLKSFGTLLLGAIEKFIGTRGQPELIMTMVSKSNIHSIASGHFPEICFAAMKALDSNFTNRPFENTNHAGKYYTVNLPDASGKLSVKSAGGELLAQIDGKAKSISSSVPSRSFAGGLEVVLPFGEDYVITTISENGAKPTATLFDYRYRGGEVAHPLTANQDDSYSI